MQINYTILYHAIPAFLVLIILEVIDSIKEHRFKNYKNNVLSNICLGTGAFGISFIVSGLALTIYSWVYQFRLFTIPASVWWTWVICFFADDFAYYWFHRCSHEIRFFWASHAVHHSAENYTFSAALRLPWTSNITGTFLFWVWMPLLGFEPAMIITMKSVSTVYQFWLHTEKIKKLPTWFEAFFNTPSHHRIHHSSEVEFLDKNHGGNLIIWDKMFGTFQPETRKTTYGLNKNLSSTNPLTIAFHEWNNIIEDFKKAKQRSDYINYVFNAPGWSNDGSSKTAKQLQHEFHIKLP
jgi:sterol desaturase/sphingolipid hydroxylase (fatty acid hydroxylase superfamily)